MQRQRNALEPRYAIKILLYRTRASACGMLRRPAMHAQSGDAPAVHRDDLQLSARKSDAVSHARQPTERPERVAAERRVIPLGNVEPVIRADVDQRHGSGELEHSVLL